MKKLIILTIILFTVQFLAPIFGQNEQKPRLVVQTGHSSIISSVTFSPDGKTLASASSDKTIKLWNSTTNREIRTFFGHFDSIWSVEFSHSGLLLVSGSDDNTVKLWSVYTGLELKTLNGHSKGVNSVAFSPNDKLLASGSDDNTIKIWDVISGNEFKTLSTHSGAVNSIAFSPDGKILASGSDDKTVKLWDLTNGQEIKTLQGHSDSVWGVVFSPDGKTLASGSRDGSIKLWDTLNGIEIGNLKGHSSSVSSIKFSPNGKILASGGHDYVIKLWDLNTSQEINTFSRTIDVVRSIAFSPDGKTIAVGDWKKIRLFNIVSQTEMKSLSGYSEAVSYIAVSQDGKFLASSSDNRILLWNISLGDRPIILSDFGIGSSLAFSCDSKILAFNLGGIIKLWDVVTMQEIQTFKGHTELITSLSFSSDSTIMASASWDNTIKLWDLRSREELKTLKGHSYKVNSIAFSPDNKILASGSDDKTIKFWEVSTGIELKTFAINEYSIYSVMFSPDGKILASKSDKTKFWNLATGDEVKYDKLPDWVKRANQQSFSTLSDKLVKSEIEGNKIYLRYLETGNVIATLIALNENDWIITTPDGRFDTNKLENPQGLHWIMPDAPFTPLSFEVFMRDYYEPNLLPRFLKCTEEDNCDQEFKPVRNLTELNRTQPKVRIAEIKATDSPDILQVTVETEDVISEYQRDKQNKPLRSGVQDLRLFRDGQLVGYEPDTEGAVALDKNGKFTQTFNVRLPKNRDAKEFVGLPGKNPLEFNFTAYAFNVDRVKSETASQTFTLPKPLPTAKGNAYIVTIGVNANEDSRYDLHYAANDARRLQEELAKNLPTDKYQKIVRIQLISDYGKDGALTENNATKAKIKAVLDLLAGNKTVSPDVLKDVSNATLLKKVSPEDLVLIAFSGHGYADQAGIFYLLPSDIGKSAYGGLADVLQKSISSDELSVWLRDVDAGEMIMIVDACHSAAAVQGSGFKPGPMGSRGLGQLSYDKGMRILTATQAGNVALEIGQTADGKKIEGGLLTYSLVTNGIELGLADYQPKDTKIFSNEWLGFAVKDVPVLYEEISKGVRKDLLIDGKPKSGVFQVNGQKSNLNLQQPTLFDFNRRDRQYELLKSVLK